MSDARPTTIADLLEGRSDLDLCNDVFLRLVRSAEDIGRSPVLEEERVVILTWRAASLIGDGGFRALLAGAFTDDDADLSNTTDAFATLELEDARQAFRAARAWFAGSRPPRDPDERRKALDAVPADEVRRANELVWKSREEHAARLAAYIREHAAEIDEILADHEKERVTPIVADASWDAGAAPVTELVPELARRLRDLRPGAVLALDCRHPGRTVEGLLTPVGHELRIFASLAGCRLVRAESPRFFIRRGPDLGESLELLARLGGVATPPRDPLTVGILNRAILIGLVVVVVAVALFARTTPRASVRLVGAVPEGLVVELAADRALELEEIVLSRTLAAELHAEPPINFRTASDPFWLGDSVRWKPSHRLGIGPQAARLTLRCEPSGRERGDITFKVSGVEPPPVLLLGSVAIATPFPTPR